MARQWQRCVVRRFIEACGSMCVETGWLRVFPQGAEPRQALSAGKLANGRRDAARMSREFELSGGVAGQIAETQRLVEPQAYGFQFHNLSYATFV